MIALCLAYFTQLCGFYFFITWMPTYLENARGFTSTTLGIMAGLPLVMSAAADLFGGLTTDWATKRFGLRVGRCVVGGACYLLASVLLIAGTATQHNIIAVILISMALASSNFLLGASWSVCTNTAGQIGGFLSPIVAALFVERYDSYSAPLYLCGVLFFWRFVLVAGRPSTTNRVFTVRHRWLGFMNKDPEKDGLMVQMSHRYTSDGSRQHWLSVRKEHQ